MLLTNPKLGSKKGRYQRNPDTHGFSRDRIMVVGDSQHSEIKVAEELESDPQILRPGVSPAPNATYRIQNLGELPAILKALI